MKAKYFFSVGFFLLQLLLPQCLLAQHSNIFAFVEDPNGVPGEVLQDNYKVRTARAIFENLVRTRGDFGQKEPAFVMNNRRQNIAWMDAQGREVGLEEKAYEVCQQFGPDSLNALAILLAHELTHYYEKHDWNRSFAQSNRNISATRYISSLDESIKQETQADYVGGFLAFSAGYNVYDIMPRLLPKLYEAYGLPPVLPGYPSLEDRIKMSRNASNQLRRLVGVYETAQMLTVLGEYRAAADYYTYILEDFHSREISNNIGTNLCLAALTYFNTSEMPYVLPLEVDANARLNSLKNVDAQRIEIRERMLREALKAFDRAIHLDPNYIPAHLNTAVTYILLGQWEDAAYWLRRTKQLPPFAPSTDNHFFENLQVLEGIMAALQGEAQQASDIFSTLAAQDFFLAQLNLDILQEKTPPLVVVGEGRAEAVVMDGIQLNRFLAAPLPMEEVKLSEQIICGSKTLAGSDIWLHYANDGKEYTVVQWAKPHSSDRTLSGLGIGSTAEDVRQHYGSPSRQVNTTKGLLWVYPGAQLLFSLDAKGRANGWGSYRKSTQK